MESRRNLFPFKSYFHFRFPLPVSWPTFAFPMSADVGQCRRRHIPVGHRRKCGGSRWNRVEICFRSKVISTSGFVAAILNFGCRYLRRPWSMSGLPKTMMSRHSQTLIHDVPVKNSAASIPSNWEHFSRYSMPVSIPFPVTWYEI